MTADPSTGARRVRCPACGKPALYAPENPARPFCGPRCRSVDLGAWASESYRVASEGPADDEPPGPALPPAH
ncbi:MAG: DNA gyrase inhibitor YacG [Burkholderiales bacterium]|nr:DNA gyrase inhibitor YacG [Burkholderiales bacterium]